MADREGFEPSVTLRLRVLSRDVVSANSPTGPSANGEKIFEELEVYPKELKNALCGATQPPRSHPPQELPEA